MARTLQGEDRMGEDLRNSKSREKRTFEQRRKIDRLWPAKATSRFVKTVPEWGGREGCTVQHVYGKMVLYLMERKETAT